MTLIRNEKLNRRGIDGWSAMKRFQYLASLSHTELLNKQINVNIYLYSKTGSRDGRGFKRKSHFIDFNYCLLIYFVSV